MIGLTIITIVLSLSKTLCLNSTLQMVNKWFSQNSSSFLISFQSLCDRSNTSVVFDSAVAYYTEVGLKVMLFSGDQLYESESVNMTDDRINLTVKSIKQLDEGLEPPIETAYYKKEAFTKALHLINVS